jgi:membrane protein
MVVVRALIKEWRQDRVGSLAAEIAFFAVLSLFPALLAVVAALGFLDAILGSELATRSEVEIVRVLEQLFTSQAEPLVDDVRTLFDNDSPALLSFATAGSLLAASRGTLAAIRSLNIAYNRPQQTNWLGLKAKALGLAAGSVLTGVFLLAIVVLGPLLGLGRALAGALGSRAVADPLLLLRYPVAFVVMVAWAWAVFHLAPNHRVSWKAEMPGALATAVLALVASAGLRAYLAVAGDTNKVLGFLGGPLILMVWFYLLSIGLLVGAELNEVLRRSRSNPASDGTNPARPGAGP